MREKYTKSDLKEMQEWCLQKKIQVTQHKIIEWYKHFDNKVYVSFSGGKDSTVLADLTARVCKVHNKKLTLVFADTGLEYPEVRKFTNEFTQWLINTYKIDVELIKLKPIKPFTQVIKEYGYPIISKDVALSVRYARKGSQWAINNFDGLDNKGKPSNFKKGMYSKYKYLVNAPFKISDECCAFLKEKPCLNYEKETGNKPIIGIMASESKRRKNAYLKNGCNSFESKRQTSTPMGFWKETDILIYLRDFNIPYASVYGDIIENDKGKLYTTGCDRTGCIFCGFGCQAEKEPNRFQRLMITHPKLYDYCMNKLGLREVLDYIGVKY